MHGGRAGSGGSRVHCDSLDEGGAQLCPCGLATATPQHFTVASRRTSTRPPRSSPTARTSFRTAGCAPLPAHIRQVGAGEPLRDVVTLVSRVLLSVTLAEPAPSGSTGTSRLCLGRSPPTPARPRTGCPQLSQSCCDRTTSRPSTSNPSTTPHGALVRSTQTDPRAKHPVADRPAANDVLTSA